MFELEVSVPDGGINTFVLSRDAATLNNNGNEAFLLDPTGTIVHCVLYTTKDVHRS